MSLTTFLSSASDAAMAYCQRAVFYLNWVNYPPFIPFKTPEKSSLIPALYPGLPTAKNYSVKTEDGIQLGLWHITPTCYATGQPIERLVFYFHGNTINRGYPNSIRRYNWIIEDGITHVVAFDYRGFGDSTGAPTEAGTMLDCRAVFHWITRPVAEGGLGVSPDKIIVWGHSLGTGIASQFIGQLPTNIIPSGLVLESPFLNTTHAVAAYIWFLPAGLGQWVGSKFVDVYNTKVHIMDCHCPVIILHGERDTVIPYYQGKELYDRALKRDKIENMSLATREYEEPLLDKSPEWEDGRYFNTNQNKVCQSKAHFTQLVLSKIGDHENLLDQNEVRNSVRAFINRFVVVQ